MLFTYSVFVTTINEFRAIAPISSDFFEATLNTRYKTFAGYQTIEVAVTWMTSSHAFQY